jgi:hypothetical protein
MLYTSLDSLIHFNVLFQRDHADFLRTVRVRHKFVSRPAGEVSPVNFRWLNGLKPVKIWDYRFALNSLYTNSCFYLFFYFSSNARKYNSVSLKSVRSLRGREHTR